MQDAFPKIIDFGAADDDDSTFTYGTVGYVTQESMACGKYGCLFL